MSGERTVRAPRGLGESAALRTADAARRAARDLPAGDILICAAHPDDCVILAGEVAIEARRRGAQVQIVYLTAGADDAAAPRAQTRRREACAVWGGLGVPPQDLTFLDLPESPVRGPLRSTPAEHATARRRLGEILRAAQPGAAVFLPAAGESHVDHRLLRALALGALVDAGRSDLTAFEAPEYNTHHALRHEPGHTLAYALRRLPLLSRLVRADAAGERAQFVVGPRGVGLPPDPQRLAHKHALLRGFASEDGEKLVRFFGGPDYFRRIADIRRAAQQPEHTGTYLRCGDVWLTPGVAALWALLWLGAALGAAALAGALFARTGRGAALASAVLLCGGGAWELRRHAAPERRGLVVSILGGWLYAAVQRWAVA